MINAIIIDDEEPARAALKTILKMRFPDVVVIGEAHSVATGEVLLKNCIPDVLFLDINLADGNGFGLLERLKNTKFQIIFVTAYNNYALKAFRVNALDYILKPIQMNDLSDAMNKLSTKVQHLNPTDFAQISKNELLLPEDQRMIIRELTGTRYIKIREILHCKADGNYTEIFLASGEKIMTTRTLKDFATAIEHYGFFRIHQSHLVNTKIIKRIVKQDGLFVEIEGGELLALSRRKKETLVNHLKGISI